MAPAETQQELRDAASEVAQIALMILSLKPAAVGGCFPGSRNTAGAERFGFALRLPFLPSHVNSEVVCQPVPVQIRSKPETFM